MVVSVHGPGRLRLFCHEKEIAIFEYVADGDPSKFPHVSVLFFDNAKLKERLQSLASGRWSSENGYTTLFSLLRSKHVKPPCRLCSEESITRAMGLVEAGNNLLMPQERTHDDPSFQDSRKGKSGTI